MKVIHKHAIPLLITLLLVSCKDFIEEDISRDTITLNAPANNLQTVILTHTFWWDDLKGAENYKIQIVEGSFSSTIKLVLDSTVTLNKFNFTLYPGQFQWRVKGMNNGSETIYTTFTLTIDSTNDITTQTVVLDSPSDNYYSNTGIVTLRWNSIYLADNYLLDIRENSWSGNSLAGFPVSSINTEYNAILNDGTYEWGVQAENSVTNTFTGFTKRIITIDTEVPDTVALVLPIHNAILGDSTNSYSWSYPTIDSGTPLIDSIYFYSDISGSVLLKSGKGLSANYSDSLGVGTFYWRVRLIDAAGNTGNFSTMRKFTIQ